MTRRVNIVPSVRSVPSILGPPSASSVDHNPELALGVPRDLNPELALGVPRDLDPELALGVPRGLDPELTNPVRSSSSPTASPIESQAPSWSSSKQ